MLCQECAVSLMPCRGEYGTKNLGLGQALPVTWTKNGHRGINPCMPAASLGKGPDRGMAHDVALTRHERMKRLSSGLGWWHACFFLHRLQVKSVCSGSHMVGNRGCLHHHHHTRAQLLGPAILTSQGQGWKKYARERRENNNSNNNNNNDDDNITKNSTAYACVLCYIMSCL
jgi:hypothetical protein